MNAGILASALSAFSGILRESGAGETVVGVQEVADFLAKHSSKSVAQLAKATLRADNLPANGSGPNAREVGRVLASVRTFLGPLVKKDVAAGFDELVRMLQGLGDTPLAALASVHVASASKKRTRKGAAPVDQILVDSYLKRLHAALGDDKAFMQLYRELRDDNQVTKQEAVGIADRFMGPVPPSTSRRKALERVLFRHRKLMGFETGSASIGGEAA